MRRTNSTVKMEFKMCSDGEFMPASLPCPPPYSGPYYFYPYENVPDPPPAAGGSIYNNNNYDSNNEGGGTAPISAGAVAGIIILVGFVISMMCLFLMRFRSRLFQGTIFLRLSRDRNGGINREQGISGTTDPAGMNSGDVLSDIVGGGGLEEKLVNLLPVFEYVKLQDADGKKLLMGVQKNEENSSCECAVCLSAFEEKEIVRILPKCKHVFHILCIDKWFESHANCPLCRERITLQTIQHFFKTSEDHIVIDVDDVHTPLDVDGGANDDDCSAVLAHVETGSENFTEVQHHGTPDLCFRDRSNHQQDMTGAPHEHQDYSRLRAADHSINDGLSVRGQEDTPAEVMRSANLQDRMFCQSFSFPRIGRQYICAQSDRKESMDCAVGHDSHEQPPIIRCPAVSEESTELGVFTYNPNLLSSNLHKFGQSCEDDNLDTSPTLSLAILSVARNCDSSRPLIYHKSLKRSVSVGSLQHIDRPSRLYYSQQLL